MNGKAHEYDDEEMDCWCGPTETVLPDGTTVIAHGSAPGDSPEPLPEAGHKRRGLFRR